MPKSWLLLLAVALAACDSATGPNELDQLAGARARWQAQGGDSYTYQLIRECLCVLSGREISVTVENGQVVAATESDSQLAVESALLSYLQTVPDLFDLIDDAILRKVAAFMVSYDAIYGYPTRIEIDYSAAVADDEISFTARNLSLSQTTAR
ncbi:MAG TPA: DUF6174 domain-containing protein [Gemmatimonadales bacterium]|jgi:hypothetical protein|nr:DUF6174 domain-containing protein [Gemmatimonadales bacterium]